MTCLVRLAECLIQGGLAMLSVLARQQAMKPLFSSETLSKEGVDPKCAVEEVEGFCVA